MPAHSAAGSGRRSHVALATGEPGPAVLSERSELSNCGRFPAARKQCYNLSMVRRSPASPALAVAGLLAAGLVPFLAFAQTSAPNSSDAAAVCQQQKNLAAARGRPDISNVFDDPAGAILKDTCVAAVINPAVTFPNPKLPQSYMCVGKRARISVTLAGLITNTNVPDPSVPAGKCVTTACTNYGSGSDCFPATQPSFLRTAAINTTSWTDSVRAFFGLSPNGGSATPLELGIRG